MRTKFHVRLFMSYIHVTFFNLKRTDKLFQDHTSQLKAKIALDVINKDICYGKLSNYSKLEHLPLQLHDISTETVIFIVAKHEKTNMTVI